MATNPLVLQGVLNRLRASVTVPLNPLLNITAAYLGKEGIRLALEGDATEYIDVMTGGVTSPQPFRRATVTAHLLKTQSLANAWKLQEELESVIGPITVRADTSGVPSDLGVYLLYNCGILGVRDLSFNGSDADYAVMIRGYYLVNAAIWLQ